MRIVVFGAAGAIGTAITTELGSPRSSRRTATSFVADGARAFATDLPDAEIQLLDTGRFALETHLDAIAGYVRGCLGRVLTSAT